jgi:hypothetical protein
MYAKSSKTGYTYFGARYGACPDEGGNSDLSLWLSVDRMSDKYPSTSPFIYVRGNPVIFVDPNGMWKGEVDDNGSVSYKAEKGDNMKTFQKQYSVSKKNAKSIFNSKDSKLDYNKDGTLKEGSSVSGKSVKAATGSDILKLDLSSDMATDQRIFDQFMFAVDYSKSKGDYGFYTAQFYGNIYESFSRYHDGKATYNGADIIYSLPLYETKGVLFKVTSYSYFLSNSSVSDGLRTGNGFSKDNKPKSIYVCYFIKYLSFGKGRENLKQQQRYFEIMTPSKNSKILKNKFD